MYWLNFLHIFQPPTQIDLMIKLVARENYQKIIGIFKKNSRAKIVLNIQGCLTERLDWYDEKKIIKDIKSLAENGQIEFTETAKFHSILPFLTEKEIKRQIELNHQTNKYYFGKAYQPEGFFFPEMACTQKSARLIKQLGYKWIILDEISHQGKFGQVKFDRIYQFEGLKIIFRNRRLSYLLASENSVSLKKYLQILKNNLDSNQFLATANDGEIFGHRYHGREKFLEQILKEKTLQTVFPSEIFKKYKIIGKTKIIDGSWSSLEGENPFKLWNDPKNEIHQMQWRLVKLALETINKTSSKTWGWPVARNAIDTFLYSCQFWWASCCPWWSIEEIEKGARGFLTALKAFKDKDFQKVQKEAKLLYNKIIQISIDWHLSGEAQKKINEFDQKAK